MNVTRLPVTDSAPLGSSALTAVHALVDSAHRADAVAPINERGRFALHGARPGVHWIATDEGDTSGTPPDETVTGWAWLDPEDASVQLVVHPDHRRRGVGRALAEAVRRDARPLHWWSFGTLPAAAALAASLGLVRERQLLIMVRDLVAHPEDEPTPPPGIELVTFTPERVDDLVRINSAAFAHHPEQGAMSVDDVDARRAEEWFDPEGLLFARDTATGELLGFHWTKVDDVDEAGERGPVGEVYVIGVHPDVHARGLGRYLLSAGLARMTRLGVRHVHLYVEADQDRAVRMYDSANFVVNNRDSSYA